MSVSFLRRFSDIVICVLLCFVAVVGFSTNSAISINAKGNLSLLNNGDRATQKVGLCFGVYSGGENVERILDIIKNKKAKATFFVGGSWADDNVEILLDILDSDCELANFGYFNVDLKKASQSVIKDEIMLCHEMVKALTGYSMKLFCPPSFSYSVTTLKIADKLGYKTVIGKKNIIETNSDTVGSLFRRATDSVSAGDFIMLYPTDGTVAVLERVITYLENAGLCVTTVSDCL